MIKTALTAIVILIIFLLPFTLPMGALLLGIKWMTKGEKKHPNRYKSGKGDSFCYWYEDND